MTIRLKRERNMKNVIIKFNCILRYLASLYAIDLTMKRLVQTAAQLERETIIIFQSDNGGSIHAYDVKVPMPDGETAPRACNFPYRGYKNSLFEGGTLSPAFVYSTKRQFASPQVDSIVHITDWFPTILKFAKYQGNVPRNLDGVDQRKSLHLNHSLAFPNY